MKRPRQISQNRQETTLDDFWGDSEDPECLEVAPPAEVTPTRPPQPAYQWITDQERAPFDFLEQANLRRATEEEARKKILAPGDIEKLTPDERAKYWERMYYATAATPAVRAPTPLQFAGSADGSSPPVSRGRSGGVVGGAPTPDPCRCTDFACLAGGQTFRDMDCFAWCKNHGILKPTCPTHGDAHLKEEPTRWVCQHPMGGGTYCRKVATLMSPPVNPTHLFTALHVLANGMSIGKTCTSTIAVHAVHRNTLGPICHSIGKCCLVDSQVNIPKWGRLEVDETCIGRRKYQRGKRARRAQYWFWSATCYSSSQTTEATFWRACTRRTKTEAEAFVGAVCLGSRSRVATDCAKCYSGLAALGYRHVRVNHSVGFKAPDGTTTNRAENSHAVVKKYVRAVWGGFGKTGEQVEVRAATGAALYCGGTPHERLVRLLKLVKRHWGVSPRITLDEKAIVEIECPSPEPEEGGSGSESEEEKEEGEEDEDEEEEEPGQMFGRISARGALTSLGQCKVVYCQALRVVLKHHSVVFVDQGQKDWGAGECGPLPRLLRQADKVALLMWHSGHWLAGIAEKKANRIVVYDSRKHHEKEHRAVCVEDWSRWVKELWKEHRPRPKVVMKSGVEQEAEGSHNGGVHSIRHILKEMGVTDAPTYGRSLMIGRLKERAKVEEEEVKAKAQAIVEAETRKSKKPVAKKKGKK